MENSQHNTCFEKSPVLYYHFMANILMSVTVFKTGSPIITRRHFCQINEVCTNSDIWPVCSDQEIRDCITLQVHTVSPLVTELWQYSVKDMSWKYLPPPPADTNIMPIGLCTLTMADLPTSQLDGKTMKSARFTYDNSKHEEIRPFTNYHLKTAHAKIFSAK